MGDHLSKPIEDKNTTEGTIQQHDLIYVSSTMQGWRKSMEDMHTIEWNIPKFPDYSFFGVYDGHRGKHTAEFISKNLHLNIFKKIHEIGEENIEEAIKDAFMQTDNDWKDESSKLVPDENFPSMYDNGSTAVVTVITPNKVVYVGNLGDSRAVMSVGGLAIPLSEDHKPNLARESQRILQAGGDPDKYNLSRCFGDFEACKNIPNKGPKEQIFIAYPDVMFHKVDTDTDFLVLACDGIWDCMSSEDVINFINEDIKINKDLSKACENLMNKCLELDSRDNMTVLIVGFLHGLDKEKWMERISSRDVNHRDGNEKITASTSKEIGWQPTISSKSVAAKLEDIGVNVSRSTVSRHLGNLGYRNALPLATPMLTTLHKQKRIEWAQNHINDDWKKTLFSGKTAFQLYRNTIKHWYKNARPIRPMPKDRSKIFAWESFCTKGITSLFCSRRMRAHLS